jgi:L,D-peptidoglycan transpeptidase YkuD (ErfK/YbiS/YcfS/YnhG family)
MIITLKDKHTLKVDDFQFRCCIGKNGIKKDKREGDKCTPRGIFRLIKIYYRADRINFFNCKLKKTKIKKNMGWCDDENSKYYNKLIDTNKKVKHEKLHRKDRKYDYLIELDYNSKNTIPHIGSAIFLHLTNDYKPTAGCIAMKKNDMEILLKIIEKKTYIKVF